MHNPFEPIDARLSNLEALTLEVLQFLRNSQMGSASINADPYGDFRWLCNTCPSIPASTLRVKSAAGEIPGVVKFGKRVLYEKKAVLDWLQSQTRKPVSAALIDQQAETQFDQRHKKRGEARA